VQGEAPARRKVPETCRDGFWRKQTRQNGSWQSSREAPLGRLAKQTKKRTRHAQWQIGAATRSGHKKADS
jgi:hypothetical protein